MLGDEGRGVVGAAVVDDDDSDVLVLLLQEGLQVEQVPALRLVVVGGDDHAHRQLLPVVVDAVLPVEVVVLLEVDTS